MVCLGDVLMNTSLEVKEHWLIRDADCWYLEQTCWFDDNVFTDCFNAVKIVCVSLFNYVSVFGSQQLHLSNSLRENWL